MPAVILLDEVKLRNLVDQQVLDLGVFKFESSMLLDLAYQALELGYIPEQNSRPHFQNIVVENLADNYRFIHRHFGRMKALYVMILRICFLHNPLKECYYFLANRTPKIKIKETSTITDFSNVLIDTSQKVSVIIPTLNRYEYLKDVLLDLEQQTYKNFDVWVCDQSDEFNEDFYKGWDLEIKLIEQKDKALWKARNSCVRNSNSNWLLFSEDDVRIDENWIINHLKVASFFCVDIVSGVFHDSLNLPKYKSKFKISSFFASGNGLVRKSVFDHVGMFDTAFEKMRMGDGEFGIRCFLNGYRLIQNPMSNCVDLKANTGGLRQMGAWDAIHNIGIFKPKPIPSSLYFARKHFDKNTAFIYGLTQLPKAFIPYSKKNSKIQVKLLYYMVSLIFSPLLLINFMQSWSISSKMIQKYKNNLTNV
jgi:glycosyltransferase involved in cell wall biosynthesis